MAAKRERDLRVEDERAANWGFLRSNWFRVLGRGRANFGLVEMEGGERGFEEAMITFAMATELELEL